MAFLHLASALITSIPPRLDAGLAAGVLGLHLLIIAFNIAGLVVVPLGIWRGWRWVREPLWRSLHLLALAVVALQAVLGRACFLTVWQDDLQHAAAHTPLIQKWVDSLIYWPLPMAFFMMVYVLVFVYVVLLWWRWPPRRDWRNLGRAAGKKPKMLG